MIDKLLEFFALLVSRSANPSNLFLLEEVKRLTKENIDLKMRLKILEGHNEIIKKIDSMSELELYDYVKSKSDR